VCNPTLQHGWMPSPRATRGPTGFCFRLPAEPGVVQANFGHSQTRYLEPPPQARSRIPSPDTTVAVPSQWAKISGDIPHRHSQRLSGALCGLANWRAPTGNCFKRTSSLHQTFQALPSPPVPSVRSTGNLTKGEWSRKAPSASFCTAARQPPSGQTH